MGETVTSLNFRHNPKFWAKIIIPAVYIIWATVFIINGLKPVETRAISAGELTIPAISLSTEAKLTPLENGHFSVPDLAAGVYRPYKNKVFAMGHKTTIFSALENLSLGDTITYNGLDYTIKDIVTKKKSNINMSSLLSDEPVPTIVLMTCAGDRLTTTDYTHRLVITATVE